MSQIVPFRVLNRKLLEPIWNKEHILRVEVVMKEELDAAGMCVCARTSVHAWMRVSLYCCVHVEDFYAVLPIGHLLCCNPKKQGKRSFVLLSEMIKENELHGSGTSLPACHRSDSVL